MLLGHLFLCCAAGFSLHLYNSAAFSWSLATFAILCGHGILGVLFSYGCQQTQFSEIFNLSLDIVEILPLPFINSDLYITYKQPEIAHLHIFTAAVPIILNFILKDRGNEDITNLLIIGNVLSLLYLGVQKEKILYAALAGLAARNRFNVDKNGRRIESLSYGLSIFCLLAAYIIKPKEFMKYM